MIIRKCGRLELFRKFIRFGTLIRTLGKVLVLDH